MDRRHQQPAAPRPMASSSRIPMAPAQRIYATQHEAPEPPMLDDFAFPMGSLYSIAAQEDAMAMEQENAPHHQFQHRQQHGGMNRTPFFRPYQVSTGVPRPLTERSAYIHQPSSHTVQSTSSVTPHPHQYQPQLSTQRQQFFAPHMHGAAFGTSDNSSSPSPSFRARTNLQSEHNSFTPSQSDECIFAFDAGHANSQHAQRAEAFGVETNSPYARQPQTSSDRAPLRAMQQLQSPELTPATGRAHAAMSSQAQPDKANTAPRNRHGIRLKPVTALPDMWRTIFRFPVFNAVQSTCYESVFESDRNLVVSAPTGSGKTVVFELAIIRMILSRNANAKAVYLAPTKALCSERAKDWAARFGPLGCSVVEITGDTNFAGLSLAKNARVIITTPEKWDSLTRRWSDHDKILSNLAVLLIDEVHILHEKERGARLEVIVSRMKNYGQAMRFIALSATVPNLADVAEWIGCNAAAGPNPKASEQGVPATFADLFKFDDEFRPCHLSKFVYGYPKMKDEFAFTASLNKHLIGLVKEHAKGKPCLIFVSTRKGTVQAADAVAKEFVALEAARDVLPWNKPPGPIQVQDPKLEDLAKNGIAFHHAGMALEDRRNVEQAFLSGAIKVLCATTTLATGVNLPAYCVIIRGTKQYTGGNGGWTEISDLDFIQMIGRAGRPQFDSEGVAVVMTENDQKQHYINLASGNTVIESTLASELVEHINAELVLRGTSSKQAIERWIEGTFLHVRLLKNPSYYHLDESTVSKGSKAVLQSIVENALQQLNQHDLATSSEQHPEELAATDFGDILAKYFLSFKTMLLLLQIPNNTTTKDLLERLTEAEEFKDIRMRQGEKNLFATLCKHEEIRFPPAKVNGVKEKISLLIQAVLAGLSLQECLGSKTAGYSPQLDAFLVFRHAPRIVKAMFDIFLAKQYGQALHHAFTLIRSINGRSWEGKPTVLRQLEGVGEKTFKILSGAGMLNVADVAAADPRRIEMLLNRNPPFGDKLVNNAKSFPHFHLDVEQVAHEVKDDGVQITIKVKAGLIDMGVHVKTTRKESRAALAMCIVTMSSDLTLFDFRKMPLKKLTADKEFKVTCKLVRPSQRIVVTAACDEIAGSAIRSELRHGIPASAFPDAAITSLHSQDLDKERALQDLEEYIDFFDRDADLHLDSDSDKVMPAKATQAFANPATSSSDAASKSKEKTSAVVEADEESLDEAPPEKLPNGNYKCLHQCKSKCRHLCCREGMEKPPHRKRSKKKKHSDAASSKAQPTLLERLRKSDDTNFAASSASSSTAQSQAPGSSGPRARPKPLVPGALKSSLKLAPGPKDDIFSEDSDERPLQHTRKRKYSVNWTAYEQDDDDDELPDVKSIVTQPATKKARPAKVTFSKYIDDEAGEDNRLEHASRSKKDKRPSAAANEARAETSNAKGASDEESAGSLVDFIVEDDAELSFHYSDDEGDLTGTHEEANGVSRGDLVDREIDGFDELAHLFSDSDNDDALPVRQQVTDHAATKAGEGDDGYQDLESANDPGGSLFFSEYDPSSDVLPATQLVSTSAQIRGPKNDAPDLVNEDMALGIRDDAGPSPPRSKPVYKPAPTQQASQHQASTPASAAGDFAPTPSAGGPTSQPAPSASQRRATFADRMLAKWRQAQPAILGQPGASADSGLSTSPPQQQSAVEVSEAASGETRAGVGTTARVPNDHEIWGDWDLLKG